MKENMKPSGIEWIGDIPESWDLNKIRYTTELRNETGMYSADEIYLSLENIESFTGKIIETETIYEECKYDKFCKNDVLFSKLRPYLAKATIAQINGFCTGELAVINKYNGDKRYLFYYMLSDGFLKIVDSSTFGTKMPRASWDFIKNLAIPEIPLLEQTQIANFLDKHCGKIDSIITDLEKQIEILGQYEKSLITEKTYSSNWEKTKIKFIGEIRGRIGFRGYTVEDTVDPDTLGCAVVLGGTNIMKDGSTNYSDLTYLSEAKYFESPEIILNGGEIIITKVGAGTGENSMYDGRFERATINPNVMLFLPNGNINSRFINYLLLSNKVKDDMKVESTKSGAQPAINQGYINNLEIFIPSLKEQIQIANYLDAQCSKIDSIIESKKEQLTKITEHKKSLIYEYVTGKKRVKGELNYGN